MTWEIITAVGSNNSMLNALVVGVGFLLIAMSARAKQAVELFTVLS